MKSSRRTRSLVNLIVLMTMWFNVFAPALSHAVPIARDSAAYTAICTATGTKLIRVDTSSSPTEQQQQLHNDTTCLVCALHSVLGGLPPSEYSPDFSQDLTETYLQKIGFQRATRLKWSPGSARAPPLSI